jgi:hypothetical protein
MIRPVCRVGNEKSGNVRNDGSKGHDRNYFNHDSGRNKGELDCRRRCCVERQDCLAGGRKESGTDDGILCGRSGMRRRSLITMVSRIETCVAVTRNHAYVRKLILSSQLSALTIPN